jgi:HEAT repeat protein
MPTFCRSSSALWTLPFIGLLLNACIVSTDHTAPTPEQVMPHLVALLKDQNPELRRTAVQSLGKIARPEAVPALFEALEDTDAGVRRNAAWALGVLSEDALEEDLAPLALLLFDSDPGVREAAASTLGLTGYTQVGIELLLERLAEPDAPEDSKRLIAAMMGNMEAGPAVPALIRLLTDRSAKVRRGAVAALGEITDEQAVAPLGALLIKDPDPGVRVEAAFRLGKFGGAAAKPALTAALKDSNADVRRLAAAALKDIGGSGKS